MEPLLIVLTLVVMLAGLVGVVVPVMPGLLLVWIAGVASTLWVAADGTGWVTVAVLTLLFLAGSLATIWLPARQGRQGGVPASSLIAALVGALVGVVVIPVVGFLIGAAVGLLAAERLRLDAWEAAWRSVGRVVRGYGIGVLVELVIGLLMIGTWLTAALLRG